MVDDEMVVTLAQVRMQLREIDGKIAAIRQETDFYRRIGFGRDIKDIQLMALEDERAEAEAHLLDLERKLKRSTSRQKQPLVAWLLLPVLFLLMGLDTLSAKRRSPRERVPQAHWRLQPRVSFHTS
ncbi:MAG: hypothetical protein M1343_12050 [Chloroflexi bacterium]|nr:hypothetical protein [Chloroflexota bacterium]